MIRHFSLFLLVFVLFVSCEDSPTLAPQQESESVEQQLLSTFNTLQKNNSGLIEIKKITAPDGYKCAFEITFPQPLDHENPFGQFFGQKIFLSHLDFSKPMVFVPAGYSVYRNSILELTQMLDANQIIVTTRFFDGAKPDPLNWDYLTLKQEAGDYHAIVSLFKLLYRGAWVSHGVSKGGVSAAAHRRFYSDDVDATVLQVTPFATAEEDPRINEFIFEEVGTEECRLRIKEFQRQVLNERETMIPLIENMISGYGLTLSIGADVAFEYSVLEYPFSFWQFGNGDCSVIPPENAGAQEIVEYFTSVILYPFYSDYYMELFAPATYQAYTENGNYGYITEHVSDLLISVQNPTLKIFGPKDVEMVYNPAVMPDMISWLQSEGDNIIYIYGGNDPWTAAAIELTGQTNAIKIVQEGANHGVDIADLTEKNLVINTLEEWLGVDVQTPIPALGKKERSLQGTQR